MLCACQSGCVQRRMTVRSNPPGALLYVDGYEIGPTPVSVNFTYYGTREFKLVKDGYETYTEKKTILPPWYEFSPMDFVAENFVPGNIHDQRDLYFQLQLQVAVPPEQLRARAEALRHGIHASTGTATQLPAGGNPPPGTIGGTAVSPPPGAPMSGPSIGPSADGSGGQPLYQLPPSGR